jgi:hypothetical protein
LTIRYYYPNGVPRRGASVASSINQGDFKVTVATEIHRARWTGERIARLGFLLGLGWDAKRVAADPIIASTPNNVHRQAQRFGLAFRAAAAAMSLNLPPDATSHFDAAASKRNLTREAMIRILLLEVAADPNLLDNILDDGV